MKPVLPDSAVLLMETSKIGSGPSAGHPGWSEQAKWQRQLSPAWAIFADGTTVIQEVWE